METYYFDDTDMDGKIILKRNFAKWVLRCELSSDGPG
jgi:hypothetical protein